MSGGWIAPFRVELVGSTKATTLDGITAEGNSPVLALCRKLIDAGHNPAAPMECWRGGVLALTVRSIGEGARLIVEEKGGKAFFAPYRPRPAAPGSPIRRTRDRAPDIGPAKSASAAAPRPKAGQS